MDFILLQMDTKQQKELLEKYLTGNCSASESAIVQKWYQSELDSLPSQDIEDPIATKNIIWKSITIELALNFTPEKNVNNFRYKWLIAATLLIAIGVASYFYAYLPYQQNQQFNKIKEANILPVGNSAVLKLADGSTINLEKEEVGSLITAGNTKVKLSEPGLLNYFTKNTDTKITQQYNTIITPKGGQFKLSLSDGTKVWLNANTSFTFPVVFTQNERTVTLNGEAYFEVAEDSKRLFKVATPRQTITVKGTHFNVNNYTTEANDVTTLLEGVVEVQANIGNTKTTLTAGQQHSLNTQNQTKVAMVNTQATVAWVNKTFDFDNETLISICRKLERWYNIDFVVEQEISQERFSGKIAMDKDISQVLKIFRSTKLVQIKLENVTNNKGERRILIYK